MGEVYRARDMRLERDVALKILPHDFAHDVERRRRFEREARLLASLNHPAIAALHGLEETDGILCLVMELVEGATLLCLQQGPIRVSEALALARQIAEGLEAAHERGVLHRDLKPSNIKVTPQGRVKLLDFGLAQALRPEGAREASVERPTTTADTTGKGAALGTAPYMSPEQARGEALDRRTDVWAFGCVLYEMLSGRRAFPGPSHAEAIAAVLEREPDWAALPAATPPIIRRLLRRCLEKDKARRLHDIGDARLELEEAQLELVLAAAAAPVGTKGRRVWLWTAGLLAAGAAGGLIAFQALRLPRDAATTARRLTLAPPARVKLPGSASYLQHLTVSPDGTRVAFMGSVEGEGLKLYLQAVDEIEARAVPHTESAHSPFFSPDGLWLAFQQGRRLLKLRLESGEAPIAIADVPEEGELRGGSWGPDGTIVFSPGPYEGLWQVSADGGKPRLITSPDAQQNEVSHRWPQALPGRQVVFTVHRGMPHIRDSGIGILSVDSGKWRVVVEQTGYARYSPTGHLVYAREGTLFAAPFDLTRGETTGPATPVLDDVHMNVGTHKYADYDISAAGSLVYIPGFPRSRPRALLWVGRDGHARPLSQTRQPYVGPRLSPDGRQLVVVVDDDLWRLDLEKDAWTRLRVQGPWSTEWSPDGRWLAFEASGRLMRKRLDGSSAEPLSQPLTNVILNAWSPDGRALVFSAQPSRHGDIGMLSLETREVRWLLTAEYLECCAALSPDGRFMAYVSAELGRYDVYGTRNDVYVRAFPGDGEKHLVSIEGGMQPRWSRDGRELFYRSLGDRPKLMAVAVETRGTFRAGVPRPLFDDVYAGRVPDAEARYDVAVDNRGFVFTEQPPDAVGPTRLVLIPDWASELRAKLRAARP